MMTQFLIMNETCVSTHLISKISFGFGVHGNRNSQLRGISRQRGKFNPAAFSMRSLVVMKFLVDTQAGLKPGKSGMSQSQSESERGEECSGFMQREF